MKLQFANFLLVIGLVSSAVSVPAVSTQSQIEFRNTSVENQFPEGIVFRVEVCGRANPLQVVFNYQVSGFWAWGEDTRTVYEGETADDCDRWKSFLDTQALAVPPFSPIKYFWSVTDGTTVVSRTSNDVYYYRDTIYDWNTIHEDKVAVWWHDRPDAFGQEVMYVASLAYDDQAKFYSLSLESPVTVVIANTEQEFSAWREEETYAGGFSFPEVSLTIQLVEGDFDYYDWMSDVIPHEISHIYFSHLVKRYSGATTWLEEGMCTYHEYSDHLDEWKTVRAAQEAGELLSLKDLEYEFGEDEEKIDLAYAESYYAILYMDEVYGRDAIATLLYEYSKGTGATFAFEKSFGKTPEQFESDFITWLPTRLETYPPNTDIPKPPQSTIVVNNEAENVSPAPPYLAILLAVVLGVLSIFVLLKPRRKLVEKRNKTRIRP